MVVDLVPVGIAVIDAVAAATVAGVGDANALGPVRRRKVEDAALRQEGLRRGAGDRGPNAGVAGADKEPAGGGLRAKRIRGDDDEQNRDNGTPGGARQGRETSRNTALLLGPTTRSCRVGDAATSQDVRRRDEDSRCACALRAQCSHTNDNNPHGSLRELRLGWRKLLATVGQLEGRTRSSDDHREIPSDFARSTCSVTQPDADSDYKIGDRPIRIVSRTFARARRSSANHRA